MDPRCQALTSIPFSPLVRLDEVRVAAVLTLGPFGCNSHFLGCGWPPHRAPRLLWRYSSLAHTAHLADHLPNGIVLERRSHLVDPLLKVARKIRHLVDCRIFRDHIVIELALLTDVRCDVE